MAASPALASSRWGEYHKLVATAWTFVDRAYVDASFNGQNWWRIRRQALEHPLPTREAAYAVIEDMLSSLGDPFTRFLDPQHFASLQTSTAGELSGVGLQIAVDQQQQIVVVSPIEGSPAETAQILPGDVILAVDGESVQNWGLDEVAEKMRGSVGTTLRLLLQRGQEQFQIQLVRQSININPVRFRLIPSPTDQPPVGYIRLSQFNGNAAQEVKEAMLTAERAGVEGYILDLRNNSGGLLQSAIEIAQMWLDTGDIVLVTGRAGIQDRIAAAHQSLTHAPLVVLVNQGTASASEILAGALQDNHRARLVGTRTFGKGLIQSLFELQDGSGLAVTTARYLTPQGRDIHEQGITPDDIVEVSAQVPLSAAQMGTDRDYQFQKGLQILRKPLVAALA
jgi:carboxyl-terminal processing protease